MEGAGAPAPLKKAARPADLKPGTWILQGQTLVVCFDLPKGSSVLTV